MSEGMQKTPWRPISNAPRNGTRVLVYATLRSPHEKGFCTIGQFEQGMGWVAYSPVREVTSGLVQIEPTHWMPLPEPPQ